MQKHVSSKSIVIISAILLVLDFILLKLDVLGLVPIFVILISFFMLVIHCFLFLLDRNGGNIFEAYLEADKTTGIALESGLKIKKNS